METKDLIRWGLTLAFLVPFLLLIYYVRRIHHEITRIAAELRSRLEQISLEVKAEINMTRQITNMELRLAHIEERFQLADLIGHAPRAPPVP